MSLVQEIDKIEKEVAASLQYAVKRKEEILAMAANVDKRFKELGGGVKDVLQKVGDSHRNLEMWSRQYDGFVTGAKYMMAEFPKYKKEGDAAEKFFKHLDEEKAAHDAERKKPGYKRTTKDEIFDAAYKKAKVAQENNPYKGWEAQLKNIKEDMKVYEEHFHLMKDEAEQAMKELDEMVGAFVEFKKLGSFDHKSTFNVKTFNESFATYFGLLKGFTR